jgi:hypothetical protein
MVRWQHINGAAFYSLSEPEFTEIFDQVIVDIEDDLRYRLGFNAAAREFPYDAALYVAIDRLKRTDYPRYRRNAHRIQCAPRPRTKPALPSVPCVAEFALARAQTLRLCAASDETNRSR